MASFALPPEQQPNPPPPPSSAPRPGGGGDQDSQRRYDEFVRWLVENGAEFPQLELREYDADVRGVHAREDLQSDQVVVAIPLKCLITVEMGKETEVRN